MAASGKGIPRDAFGMDVSFGRSRRILLSQLPEAPIHLAQENSAEGMILGGPEICTSPSPKTPGQGFLKKAMRGGSCCPRRARRTMSDLGKAQGTGVRAGVGTHPRIRGEICGSG